MLREMQIKIWNQVAGYAAYSDTKLVHFEYADSLPLSYELSPLMMPRGLKKIWSFDLDFATYQGLPGMLADSLPDSYGRQMMDTWFSREGIALSQISALDRLCYLGTRAMGALEFHPCEESAGGQDKIELKKLVDVSRKILQNKTQFSASEDELSKIIQMGSSAGGARAKAVVAMSEESAEIRSGHLDLLDGFMHWLVKFDGLTNEELSDPLGYTNIEYAYYLMARAAGIEMSPSKLLREGDHYHFATKRFDRKPDGSKLHMQTLCALAHLDYNMPRITSYEILFRIANRLELSMHDKEQIFKRMVFNVVGRNHDDHTKNFAFLMDEAGKWGLAPAYDLTFAYKPDHYWLKEHNMLVNSKTNEIEREDLMVYAETFHIKNAEEYINEIVEIFGSWGDFAEQAYISKTRAQELAKYFLLL